MNTLQKRFLLFLIGCMGARLLLAYTAKTINKRYLPYMGIGALCIAFGFIYLYFTDGRKTGPEVFGGKIWWNELRIVHAAIYIVFAIYALQEKSFSWLPLGFDALVGFVSFMIHHYTSGNINKLF
jgi:hypothetical protein